MHTIEILKKVYNDTILKQIFIGVFASDKIPKLEKIPSAITVNLDVSENPGTHWMALYFPNEGKCEYFDSFGRKPSGLILKYISNYSKAYTYNNVCVQDLWTISCGKMCLYYLVWRCRGITFKEIIESMTSDGFIVGFIDSL